jgi:hypothetical protein
MGHGEHQTRHKYRALSIAGLPGLPTIQEKESDLVHGWAYHRAIHWLDADKEGKIQE